MKIHVQEKCLNNIAFVKLHEVEQKIPSLKEMLLEA